MYTFRSILQAPLYTVILGTVDVRLSHALEAIRRGRVTHTAVNSTAKPPVSK